MHRQVVEDTVGARLHAVQRKIQESARATGRGPVELIAVTKTVPVDVIREAYLAGQRTFGENRVQEAVAKVEAVEDTMPDATWQLIGRLQTNKARKACEIFSVIQTVDSVRLARVIDEHAQTKGKVVHVLVQVNVAGEASKSGLAIPQVRDDLTQIAKLKNVAVRGFMTIAPLVANPEDVRPVFRALRELRDEVQAGLDLSECVELSMGMSHDFLVAIQEGATMVRIGRSIFGERASPVSAGSR